MTMTAFGARGESLAPHTSLRIGGPADFFLRVATEKDLLDAIQVARETADVLVDAELVDMNGDTWTARVDELGYSYRTSSLQGTPIVCVRARFRGRTGDRANAVKRIKEMANERIKKQPLAQPNTGSIFRNPPGDHAGRLIEAAGLKGKTIGGAMVSPKHANFIVNANGATADDVRALMALVQGEVAKKFNVKLVPEVELVGDW